MQDERHLSRVMMRSVLMVACGVKVRETGPDSLREEKKKVVKLLCTCLFFIAND